MYINIHLRYIIILTLLMNIMFLIQIQADIDVFSTVEYNSRHEIFPNLNEFTVQLSPEIIVYGGAYEQTVRLEFNEDSNPNDFYQTFVAHLCHADGVQKFNRTNIRVVTPIFSIDPSILRIYINDSQVMAYPSNLGESVYPEFRYESPYDEPIMHVYTSGGYPNPSYNFSLLFSSAPNWGYIQNYTTPDPINDFIRMGSNNLYLRLKFRKSPFIVPSHTFSVSEQKQIIFFNTVVPSQYTLQNTQTFQLRVFNTLDQQVLLVDLFFITNENKAVPQLNPELMVPMTFDWLGEKVSILIDRVIPDSNHSFIVLISTDSKIETSIGFVVDRLEERCGDYPLIAAPSSMTKVMIGTPPSGGADILSADFLLIASTIIAYLALGSTLNP